MSLSRIDDRGGSVDFKDGLCWIKSGNKTIGKGYKKQRLYMLHARAILMEKETANYASTEKLPGTNGTDDTDTLQSQQYKHSKGKIW